MAQFVIYGKDGEPIVDWRDWERPATAGRRWKAGRSGIECARAWLARTGPMVPAEIRQLLDGHPSTGGVEIVSGYPEHVTRLPPNFGSDGRNHDLDLVANLLGQPVTICVEANADEKLGKRLGPYFDKMRSDDSSEIPSRIQALLELLWDATAHPTSQPWSDLRYQLVAGAAGTVLEAERKGASTAVFVIHEFRTTATKALKIQRNAEDYAAFVQALCGVPADQVAPGVLYGPRVVTRRQHLSADVQLLVGKAVYDWKIALE